MATARHRLTFLFCLGLIAALANMDPPPESVPINTLVKVEGTPLTESEDLDPFEIR